MSKVERCTELYFWFHVHCIIWSWLWSNMHRICRLVDIYITLCYGLLCNVSKAENDSCLLSLSSSAIVIIMTVREITRRGKFWAFWHRLNKKQREDVWGRKGDCDDGDTENANRMRKCISNDGHERIGIGERDQKEECDYEILLCFLYQKKFTLG